MHCCQTSLGRLIVIGADSTVGTYVLKLRVPKRLTMRFGRFKRGKLITVEPGDYAYTGSALGRDGVNKLTQRLVRHATRTGLRRPHPIRQVMLKEFERIGLGCGDLRPRAGKTLRWNVDFLLDQPSVELVAAYLIRSPLRLEFGVANLIEFDPATIVFEPGLGAADHRGHSHLVCVAAGDEWWDVLGVRLCEFFSEQTLSLSPIHLSSNVSFVKPQRALATGGSADFKPGLQLQERKV